jgi:hypothetical protein
MRPASRSVKAGGEPLYGTSSIFTPAAFMKAAATSCWPVPAPAVATVIDPGFALAMATMSKSFSCGKSLRATMT